MTMDRKTLAARMRQLQAVDTNAQAIYSELAKSAGDSALREIFSRIADDENRHVALGKEILSLLEE